MACLAWPTRLMSFTVDLSPGFNRLFSRGVYLLDKVQVGGHVTIIACTNVSEPNPLRDPVFMS